MQLDDWQREILNYKGDICLCAGRQCGKSTIIAMRDGERAARNKNESILIISATERQAYMIFEKVLAYLLDNYPNMVKKGKDRPTKHEIKLTNGSIIRCYPVGTGGVGIRGLTLTKLTGEEAHYIPEEVWTAVTPMLLTTGGNIDLLGTPHGNTGFFYDCFLNKDGRFKTFRVNSEQVLKNRKIGPSWTEAQRDKAIQFLEMEKKRMTDLHYRQEYLAEFLSDLCQMFPDELIKKCQTLQRDSSTTSPLFSTSGELYCGVDVARLGGDETAIITVQRRNKERLKMIDMEVYTKKLTSHTVDRILTLDLKYHYRKIYIDTTGMGWAVFDPLLAKSQTANKVVSIENSKRSLDRDEKQKKRLLKEDLYANLLKLMEDGKIELFDDDEIYLSLKSVQFEINPETKETKISATYGHIAEALIRAAWCMAEKGLNLWCAY